MGEIKRRKVFQVAAVYAVVAWLLVQIVATVEEPLGLPMWFDTGIIVLLAVGFPIALVFAWAFEITPDGIRSAGDSRASKGATASTSQRLTYVTHGLVLLAVGFLVVDQYLLDRGGEPNRSARDASSPSEASTSPVRRYVTNLGSTQAIGNSGLAAQLAISSDGRRIAYVLRPGDRELSQLFVRQLDEIEGKPLANTAGAENPFFSPDGEWVGYFTDTTDRGGPAVPLANTAIAPGGFWRLDDAMT